MAAKTAGEHLRDAILDGLPPRWELDERETELLALAAAQADVVEKLEGIVEIEGLTATGSTGQPVVHPAVVEARQGRLAIDRLLGKVVLPVPETDAGTTSASEKGRHAAEARWSRERLREVRRGAA